MTERQKMISGQLYKSGVKELVNDRMLCKEQCYDFNALRPSQTEEQTAMIKMCIRDRHSSRRQGRHNSCT